MLLRLLEILFPVFAIVVLGAWMGRRHTPDMRAANQLNLDVFIPALVFSALANRSYELAHFSSLALAATVIVLGGGLLALPVCRWCGIDPKTLAPTQMFNNCGNLGLPVAVLAFGPDALAPAVVMFLVSMLLHASLGAWLLDHQARWQTLWRTPIVGAAVLGLMISVGELPLWPPVLTMTRMLGDVSVPIALFSLGVRLADTQVTDWRLAMLAGVLRPVTGIGLGLLMIALLAIPPREASQLLLFGALPPAVMNYVFAERYRQEPERVASIVMVGNLLSLLILPLVLAWQL